MGNTTIIIVFACYMAVMIGVGLFFFKRNTNLSDYILGGRQLNKWVAALSAQASDMSSWLLMGLPGLAYLSAKGAQEAIWTAIGLGLGSYLSWLFVAKRLRQYTYAANNSITLPDFFENRFRDKSRVIKTVSSLFILIFFLLYTASMFKGGAVLFQTVFGISYVQALTIGAVVLVLYTFLGGFMAVCWTDLLQGLLMVAALVVVPIVAVTNLGGVDSMLAQVDMSAFKLFPDGTGATISVMTVVSALAWGFGYFGMPHIVVRYMAIKKTRDIRSSRIIALVWIVISLTCAVIVGIVGKAYLHPELAAGAQETVFIVMVTKMFPSVITGILLSAILAAVMSTADSQLLVTASSISEDFYRPFIRKNASDKELVWVGRISVIVVSVIAYFMAYNPESTIFELVAYAWAGLGSAFGPAVLFSLFWKRATKSGVISGIVAGGLVAIGWKSVNMYIASLTKAGAAVPAFLQSGVWSLYEMIPGVLIATVLIVVISLLSKAPSQEILDEFDRVKDVV